MSVEDELVYDRVSRGTSVTRNFGLDGGGVLTNWACKVQLRDAETKELIIDRTITTTNQANTEFVVTLTGADTTIGDNSKDKDYVLAAELTNSTTSETVEGSCGLTIVPEWVYD